MSPFYPKIPAGGGEGGRGAGCPPYKRAFSTQPTY